MKKGKLIDGNGWVLLTAHAFRGFPEKFVFSLCADPNVRAIILTFSENVEEKLKDGRKCWTNRSSNRSK